MRITRPLLALLSLLLPVATARGQVARDEPRAVADSFFHLLAAERYRDAAGLLDLEAFDAARHHELDLALESPRQRPHFTAAAIMRANPKMPRAVAEYQAKRINDTHYDRGPMLLRQYGVSTLDSLKSLDVADLAARWLGMRDMRTVMRQSLRRQGGPRCNISPDSAEMLVRLIRTSPARVLGTVTDDSLAWVLFERPQLLGEAAAMPGEHPDSVATPRAGPPPERDWQVLAPSILVARRIGDRWRLVPAADTWSFMASVSGCSDGSGTARPRQVPAH